MKIGNIQALLFLAIGLSAGSCSGPQESAAMKEAKEVHEQLVRISGDLHDALMGTMAPIETQIDSAMVAGDTLLAAQLAKLEGQLDRIDVRFHEWSETVVEIPGQACTHDHDHDHSGHDHDGHDHAGHDHSGHDHDHGAQLPEGLSDAEILEIQKALMTALDSLKADFERITE